jgi:Ca-activated chloride channel family protein
MIILAASAALFAGDGPLGTDESQGPRFLEHQLRQLPAQPYRSDIRIDVNMALVPVTVMDTMGHSVTGLGAENFRVFDGSEPRPIVTFGQQDAPIAIGLVFDCSRSMRDKFKTARTAPEELFKMLNPDDESFLVTISDRAELRQPLTSNFGDIGNALVFTHPEGTTSLIDGVALGLNEVKRSNKPRKALVVVSDGGDNNSRYTMRELIQRAQEADVQIFTIGLFQNPQTQEEADGPALLTQFAQVTGGVNFVIQNPADLKVAMGKIGVTLHNQYVLGYYPPDGAPAGKYRKIKVQLMVPQGMPPLRIFARNGYYTPER